MGRILFSCGSSIYAVTSTRSALAHAYTLHWSHHFTNYNPIFSISISMYMSIFISMYISISNSNYPTLVP